MSKLNKQQPLYQEDLHNILSIKGIDRLKGKRFLITGATGMVGVMLIDALMKIEGVKIYAVGRNKEKAELRLGEYFDNPNFTFLTHDVLQPFEPEPIVDYIIPMASNTHPLAYSRYPIETIMINIKGIENALNLAYKTGATVVYTSSNEIYGNAKSADYVFDEDTNGVLDLSNARSCYNESKRLAESMCQSYHSELGVDIKIARFCRIFGPTMLPTDTKASSQFINRAIEGEDIILKSDGMQYFSYTYVAEAVIGLLTVVLNGHVGVPYNISSEKTNIRLKDFAQLCAEYNGKSVIFDLPSDEESNGFSKAKQAILSNDRIKSVGFSTEYEMRDALFKTIEILRFVK